MSDSLWLQQLRAEVKWRLKLYRSTQAALAGYVGISEKHLSQIMTGKMSGSPETLGRIAATMGLRIAIVADGPPSIAITSAVSQTGRHSHSGVTGGRTEVVE